MMVQGRKISYEIKDMDIYDLEYYIENPRINYIVSKKPTSERSQEFIESQLLSYDATKDLIVDLRRNHGLLDEVYVVGNKVVEGNTRLAAFRKIHKQTQDEKWRYIKARILQDDITDKELFFILGTFHIKGKKEWDAYEKAAYIHRAIKELGMSHEEVGQQLGHNKQTIDAMLKAHEAMTQKYLPRNSQGEEVELAGQQRDKLKKYSYFEAFYRDKDLVKRTTEAPGFEDEFVEIVTEGRLPNAQAVRDLAKILKNKKACRVFLNEEPEDAFEAAKNALYIDKPEQVDAFYIQVRKFKDLINSSSFQEIKDELSGDDRSCKSRKHQLMDCYKTLKRFCKEVGLDVK